MQKIACICLFVILLAAPFLARADHVVVLVVNAESHLDSIDSIDLRKLYLGFTVYSEQGNTIRAMNNASDPKLWQVFLQNVMGMSERSYYRRLLALTLHSGRTRPTVHENLAELLDDIESRADAVSFVWAEDIEGRDGIRILRVLWQD